MEESDNHTEHYKRQDKAKSMYVVPTIDGYTRAYGSVLHTRTTPARPRFIKYIDNTTKHLSEGRDDVTYILKCARDV